MFVQQVENCYKYKRKTDKIMGHSTNINFCEIGQELWFQVSKVSKKEFHAHTLKVN